MLSVIADNSLIHSTRLMEHVLHVMLFVSDLSTDNHFYQPVWKILLENTLVNHPYTCPTFEYLTLKSKVLLEDDDDELLLDKLLLLFVELLLELLGMLIELPLYKSSIDKGLLRICRNV